ncbi:membrane-spanning 4-domains subfamily A member 4A-like [Ranitomeya imitator]|uniref:membrane-spanning 4-domains subfamily A member 4A-like n=1 Tax=Ranitomeya imitator TaxID=111125 RepID=UPI0037E99353
MSTLTTDAEGSLIISQASPQNDQGNAPNEGRSHNAPANIPKPLATFYQGEPEILGTVQICAGILFITFGIIFEILCSVNCLYIEMVIYKHVFIWSGGLYVISGSISLACAVKPTIGKVKSNLVINIISTAAAGFSIIPISIIILPFYSESSDLYCAYYKSNTECKGAFNLTACFMGIIIFLLLLTILLFCITISTSVFGCRTICRTSYQEMTVLIYQATVLNAPPSSAITLDS